MLRSRRMSIASFFVGTGLALALCAAIAVGSVLASRTLLSVWEAKHGVRLYSVGMLGGADDEFRALETELIPVLEDASDKSVRFAGYVRSRQPLQIGSRSISVDAIFVSDQYFSTIGANGRYGGSLAEMGRSSLLLGHDIANSRLSAPPVGSTVKLGGIELEVAGDLSIEYSSLHAPGVHQVVAHLSVLEGIIKASLPRGANATVKMHAYALAGFPSSSTYVEARHKIAALSNALVFEGIQRGHSALALAPALTENPGGWYDSQKWLKQIAGISLLALAFALVNLGLFLAARLASEDSILAIKHALGAQRIHLWRELVCANLGLILSPLILGSLLSLVVLWLVDLSFHKSLPGSYASSPGLIAAFTSVLLGLFVAAIGTKVVRQRLESGIPVSRGRRMPRSIVVSLVMQMALTCISIALALALLSDTLRRSTSPVEYVPSDKVAAFILEHVGNSPIILDGYNSAQLVGAVESVLSDSGQFDSIAWTTWLPGMKNYSTNKLRLISPSGDLAVEAVVAEMVECSAKLFELLGNRFIVGGPPIEEHEAAISLPLAKVLWKNPRAALGTTIRAVDPGGSEALVERRISGVVADTGDDALRLFLRNDFAPGPNAYFLARSPQALSAVSQERLRETTAAESAKIWDGATVDRVQTLAALRKSVMAPRLSLTVVAVIASGTMLCVAVAGLLSSLRMWESSTLRATSIRAALGETPWHLGKRILYEIGSLATAAIILASVIFGISMKLFDDFRGLLLLVDYWEGAVAICSILTVAALGAIPTIRRSGRLDLTSLLKSE